jgi:methylamine dehydrogenase heavy chain
MTEVTPDKKHLLFYQFSPSPGVGLVDLEAKKFVKMMDIPDCY